MKLQQPLWPRFLPTRTVINCATLGALGQRLPAPGTWGSVAGLLYFVVFFYSLGLFGTVVLSVIGIYFAVALCGEAELRMGRKDPGEVILDEFVAMPLCFLGWFQLVHIFPPWVVAVLGFGLFRVFDITKPFGIARLQHLVGGWGVVIDDVAAALATCVVLHLAAALWPLI